MLPNLALIDYFQNLPYLALKEVSKHLMDRNRVLLSVISPKWEETISSQDITGSIEQLVATGDRFEIKIEIEGLPPGCAYPTQYETTNMTIQFINSDTDKEVITEWIEKRSEFSIDSTRSIIVYRKNWAINGSRRIIEIARLLNQKFQLNLENVTIENATWMTRNDLLSLDSETARIGDNRLTDKDFNAFLHSWMAGNQDKMQLYSFKVGENLKIDKVMEGLITERWNPKKRDRKFIPRTYDNVAQPPIDMADGYDITCLETTSDNNIATINITDNTLYFVVWDENNTFEEQLKNVKWFLKHTNRELFRGTPGSRDWNHWTETRRKCLESLRNITGDPEADVLEDEFSDNDSEPGEVHSDSD